MGTPAPYTAVLSEAKIIAGNKSSFGLENATPAPDGPLLPTKARSLQFAGSAVRIGHAPHGTKFYTCRCFCSGGSSEKG
jgi:hypothetical protein